MTSVTYLSHHRAKKTKKKKPKNYLTKEQKIYRFLIAMGAGDASGQEAVLQQFPGSGNPSAGLLRYPTAPLASFKYEQVIAEQKAKDYLKKDNKELILALLIESKKPLSRGFLSYILNIPIDHVAHQLMILKSEFKVVKSVGEYWRALSFGERERLRLINEIVSIFDMDFRLARKTIGNDSIYSLSTFDLKNLSFKLQQLV